MAIQNFDKYILHYPRLEREDDFFDFWEKTLKEVKGPPVEPVLKKNSGKSGSDFINYDVAYKSFDKAPLNARVFLPKRSKKPRVIIYIHDYNTKPDINEKEFKPDLAYCVITLRGHAVLPDTREDAPRSPGYMIEQILDRDSYYVKSLYLDTLRCIEMLRLIGNIDCSSVGIMAKGIGCACAVFAASFSERVKALALHNPTFSELPLFQNIGTGDVTREINDFLSHSRNKKKLIKQNLSYFDALNFTDTVKIPVLAVTGFQDSAAPPECVFGLFNRLKCEKTIEVYPEGGEDAGGKKQRDKSFQWLGQQLINQG